VSGGARFELLHAQRARGLWARARAEGCRRALVIDGCLVILLGFRLP